jgi:hypothetical protein
MPFLGQRAKRLRQELERLNLEGHLSTTRSEDGPGDADEITGVEVGEPAELLLAHFVAACHELDAAVAVLQVGEDHTALEPLDHEPAGQRDRVGPLAFAQQVLGRLTRLGRPETPRVRFDSRRAQSLQLLAPVAHDSW